MPATAPTTTRDALLHAAFAEFFRHGFQAGSLSAVVGAAGATKGALFHHFAGKQALGHAVVDEVVAPLLATRWLDPIADTDDPVPALQASFRRWIAEDAGSGHWVHGCPMNNLAQEMSPLDEGFRTRLDALYARWRAAVADALARGQRAGSVRADADVRAAATLVVLAQQGIWGTGKYSQDPTLMSQAGEALCAYLDALRPTTAR
ncbi:TetR/AcrR family transcriptional regulator [Roseisolibacter sp. H3M3-2]|uniref:TetR/AcrR family transcriptional regulator n=1 Tax=Roseisolibacter sp. H3M3-2 TaxID=3031323 RepID=UPI0023DA1A7E|nr:TetR/AcrR family transcriptional regulator [Roseisolibacter sp. H3M3-2]MDF1503385.1 TetR/AcrR family transcriptional regulator [Roseisolibacter sp. H3M3-2]